MQLVVVVVPCAEGSAAARVRLFYGPTQLSVPFGNGVLCVDADSCGGPFAASVVGTLDLAFTDFVHPVPGTVNFQLWYRDWAPIGATSNLTSGCTVQF